MVLGQLAVHMQKEEVGPLLHPVFEKLTQWIKDLNMRANSIKLLDESRRELFALGEASRL